MTWESPKSRYTHLGKLVDILVVLGLCSTFGTFSIENFKRPQQEVDALLALAKEKFERLIDEKDRLQEQGVRVNVIGNLTLLPQDLQDLVKKATSLTKDNSR